jgi:thiol-disulfide isomerase/thioredoxin
MKAKKIPWIAAGIVAVLAIGYLAYFYTQQGGADADTSPIFYHEGEKLPESMTLRQLDGKEVELGQYKGKVVLINFWAGWCGPCMHEMPSIAALYKKLEPRGLVVLAPAMDENPELGVRALKRVLPEIPFPVFSGMRSQIANHFELDALPHTVVLNKDLVIEFSRAGEVDWNGGPATHLIEGLL